MSDIDNPIFYEADDYYDKDYGEEGGVSILSSLLYCSHCGKDIEPYVVYDDDGPFDVYCSICDNSMLNDDRDEIPF